MNIELVLLWLLCGMILIPALMIIGGRMLANWIYGRAAGGRK